MQIPSFLILNVRSLAKRNSIEHLTQEINTKQPPIAIITESWLNSDHISSVFDVDKYASYRKDREGRRGGGVIVYVNGEALFDVVYDHALQQYELIILKGKFCAGAVIRI
jgi:hypothetical protein